MLAVPPRATHSAAKGKEALVRLLLPRVSEYRHAASLERGGSPADYSTGTFSYFHDNCIFDVSHSAPGVLCKASVRGSRGRMSGAGAGAGPVLIVDDTESARYVMTRMLERSGFNVVTAATGADALHRIATDLPPLVVLDIELPDIGGLDICRRIKADPATQHIKVLHTSAVYNPAESKDDSLESGADGYLSQPFEQEELVATVRSLLRLTHAEQALRDRADELDEANRRIHEFLAMLAHELRNPLAAIAASLPLVECRRAADETESTAREVMRRQTAQLTRLVDDLLDVARVTQGKIDLKRRTVNLTDLVTRVADYARRSKMAPRGQSLDVNVPAYPLLLQGDEMRLEQVMINLLDNASKYTDRGGWVHVDLECEDVPDAPGRARLVVRDGGIGLSPGSLQSIFDLFSQADVPLARSHGGLGVGLTLVRRLVELHGGDVEAQSAGPGEGSAFTVWLPLTGKPVRDNAGSGVAAASRSDGDARKRILLVEDNDDAQTVLTMLLELWGHEVNSAKDGLAGIAAAMRDRPDVALIALGLPGVDGFEVARRIRGTREGEGMLLVALTGYGAPADRDRALAAGFDVHVVKPIEPAKLRELVSGPAVIRPRNARIG
jgi:signal transduction histidine kinase